jgi:hypothetical protein
MMEPKLRMNSRSRAHLLLTAVVLCCCLGLSHAGRAQSTEFAQPTAGQAARLQSALMQAAAAGQLATVRTLLAQGADVNARAVDGDSALMVAVQANQIEIARMLIKAGANLNAATRGTGTALELAERTGKSEIAALLLASGARSSGESVGDTVCVLPWSGEGFCGRVKAFSIRSVNLQVTKLIGCEHGCAAREECSASKVIGGADGVQPGTAIAVPSWCLTQTGVKP